MIRKSLLLVTILGLMACESTGTYVDQDKAKNVINTVATAKDLVDALGNPSVTIPMGDGKSLWVYEGMHRTANAATYIPIVGLAAAGTNKKCSRLTALVDNQTGAVSDLKYSSAKDSDYWTKPEEQCKSD